MISVVIPVWNNADQLARALASLAQQTFTDFSVTVVDDGSRDASARDVAARSWPFPIAYHRLERNGGAPRARNEGARQSTGDELLFLDADIVLHPDALQDMHTALAAHPDVAFVYTDFRYGWKRFRGRVFDADALRQTNYIHTSALTRRSAFPGFDESLKKFQDWDLWLTISAQGGTGLWIPKEHMRVETGGTMSAWLPSFAHRIPWPLCGWMPRTIQKYVDAERVIREKHGLTPRLDEDREAAKRVAIYVFAGVALLESISFLTYTTTSVFTGMALLLGVIMTWLAYAYPVAAFSVWLAELCVGSFGGLFRAFGDASLHGGASLRMVLFIAVIVGSCVRLLIHKADRDHARARLMRFARTHVSLGVLALVLVGTSVLGWMRNEHGNVIQDANAWALWLLLPIWAMRIEYSVKRTWSAIVGSCAGALTYLTLVTWKTWYFYAHPFPNELASYTYFWIRRTGFGEITRVVDGMQLYRVFIQSHVYALLALPFAWKARKRIGSIAAYSVGIISLSRSLWVGAACMFVTAVMMKARTVGVRGAWRFFSREATSFVMAFGLVWGLAIMPLPLTSASLLRVLTSRVTSEEGAVSSRRAQLAPLLAKIKEAPVFGSGFGATATYTSADPRVLATGSNQRTTFAFEWGWLDLLVKMGSVGVLVYALVLADGLRALWKRVSPDEWIAWATATLGIVCVHTFTPYLNHPLGFGFLFLLFLRAT